MPRRNYKRRTDRKTEQYGQNLREESLKDLGAELKQAWRDRDQAEAPNTGVSATY